ncbi:hypothetical protein NX059_012331 [Plenodomus lindquistii]|nr:hypothetical protein NX059_012331 [Plenodomus lindquistii]
MAKKTANSAPTTSKGTDFSKYLQQGGIGRMGMKNIQDYFNIESASDKAQMITAAADCMRGYAGVGDLILRCGKDKHRREKNDSNQLSEITTAVQKWLKREPRYTRYFGPENTTVPEDCKTEAVRMLVFKAKERVGKEAANGDKAVMREGQMTSDKRKGRRTVDHKPIRRTIVDALASLKGHELQPMVGPSHPLLRTCIENISYYNVRLLDSRNKYTITRLPFRNLVNFTELGDAVNFLDSGDIHRSTVEQFIRGHCDKDLVKQWDACGNRLRVHHTGLDILDDIQLAVSINDYINGPRLHSDFCIILMLSEAYPEDIQGKFNVC